MHVTLRYIEGCPHAPAVAAHLRALARDMAFEVAHEVVDSPESASRLGFAGSPTVLIDGRDPFATGDEPVGLACRVYPTADGPRGAPTRQQLRDALAAAGAAPG